MWPWKSNNRSPEFKVSKREPKVGRETLGVHVSGCDSRCRHSVRVAGETHILAHNGEQYFAVISINHCLQKKKS